MKFRVSLVGAALASAAVLSACSSGTAGTASPASDAPATSSSASPAPSGSASVVPTSASAKAGGGDNAKAVSWAGELCATFTGMVDRSLVMLEDVSSEMEKGNLDGYRSAVLDYLAGTETAMSGSLKRLNELGAPTASSAALHAEMVKFLEGVGAESGAAAKKMRGLAVTDPAFVEQMGALDQGQGGSDVLLKHLENAEKDPELDLAFATAESCQEMESKLGQMPGSG
ncbi:hypothetical protein KCV87_19090 [Actinosynnema pretiosum subsp. pretiosum]|uniref:DUF305 domain-containing protein n=1 Tax=Actinosynnema pretiosum subsp. pretiosum TaxID=103721 RepID=A0AA45R1G1_9PSEU|nr:hypothetical protein APASM_0267 [Actinosynnema pretiosum subsp. pretiosum]QUF01667.1 hypothetical protein KCV87_19090 [Actinosynnema pretiosum subsp. pretiosum]